jgi:hypothetical protein
MVVSECNVVVAQTLSYPTQLATNRGLGRRIHESVEDTKVITNKQHTLSLSPSSSISTKLGHWCVLPASIFGALRPPNTTHWIFFGGNRRRIDRDFKAFSNRA